MISEKEISGGIFGDNYEPKLEEPYFDRLDQYYYGKVADNSQVIEEPFLKRQIEHKEAPNVRVESFNSDFFYNIHPNTILLIFAIFVFVLMGIFIFIQFTTQSKYIKLIKKLIYKKVYTSI